MKSPVLYQHSCLARTRRQTIRKTTIFFGVFLLAMSLQAQAPTLGTYSNTSVVAGQNTTITPSAAPTNTTSAVAYTNTNFTGIFTVNPVTGGLLVTDAKQAGTYTVTVKAFGPGGSTVTSFTLTVTSQPKCQAVFRTISSAVLGNTKQSVAIGDFNGDGKQDFAIANGNSSSVSIRLGDGAGGFNGSTEVAVGGNPFSVAIGDFNGDGHQDFAVANNGSASVSIRLGNGVGGFSGNTDVGVGANPQSIAIGDFNGDGKQDFATANFGSNNVSIRLGDGAGGFSASADVGVGLNPRSIAIGDFNGDGKQDIAVANRFSDSVSIRLGDGTGGFSGSTEVGVGDAPYSVAIGDFNGDGNQDFATANDLSGNVSIRLGNGVGGFSGNTDVGVGANPRSIAIGDFNGDGNQDFAAISNSTNYVSVRLGNGAGGFSNAVNFGNLPATSIAIGDFNGDGNQDIVTVTQGSHFVWVHLSDFNGINVQGNGVSIGDGDGTPSTLDNTDFGGTQLGSSIARTFTIQNTGAAPLTIDHIELNHTYYVASGVPGSVAGNSSATFTVTFTPLTMGVTNAWISIYACSGSAYGFALTGTGGAYANTTVIAGKNASTTPLTAPGNTTSMVAYTNTEFTGIFTVNPVSGEVRVTNARPAGTYPVTVQAFGPGGTSTQSFTLTVTNPISCQDLFTNSPNVYVGAGTWSLAIGDFNGDGNQDFAGVSNISTGEVVIRLGNGSGGFSNGANVTAGNSPVSVAIGDFNGDGKQDMAVANRVSNTVSIRLGNGSGAFSGSTEVAVGSGPRSVAIGDFNGDGKQDIAAANYGSNTISIRLGDGAGGFSGSTNLAAGNETWAVVVGDFNEDGNQDLAAISSVSFAGSVMVRLGDGAGGFSGNTNVSVGSGAQSIVIGDFNGDGHQDIATANSVGTASIRLGDGAGGFNGGTDVSVGSGAQSLAIGDFNGDGNQDIATANYFAGTVAIRLGNGAGGFGGSTSIPVGFAQSVVVGDFNGDGKQDIAATNLSAGSIFIRLGASNEINVQGKSVNIPDGDSTPGSADDTNFGVINAGTSLAHTFTIQNTETAPLSISSITSDNARFVVSGAPATVAGNSSATFTVTFFPIAAGLQDATITINNNDCDEAVYDFAVTGTALPHLPILGTYANTTVIAGRNTTVTPSLAPDSTTNIIAYTNTNFTGIITIDLATGVLRVTDAKPAGTYPVTVKAVGPGGTSTKSFTLTVTNPINCQPLFGDGPNVSSVPGSPNAVAIGDFNGDGNQDIATASNRIDGDQIGVVYNSYISIYLGDGAGGFYNSAYIYLGIDFDAVPLDLAIGDFNEDGKQDIATANYLRGSSSILLGDGTGNFFYNLNSGIPTGDGCQSIAIGDFNGDGNQDFVTANSVDVDISIRMGNGAGGFTITGNIAFGLLPYAVAIGEFNGDGIPDIVNADGYGVAYIRLGDGTGLFTGNTQIAVGSVPRSVAIGDFNGDGHQDFATANRNSNTVSIRLGDGMGGFSGNTEVAVGAAPYLVKIGDFNGDGKQDIATANRNSNTVSIRLGDGLGGFSGSMEVAVGSNPQSVAIGDFNNDGIQDLAVANNNSGTVSIRLGIASEINVQGNSMNIADGDTTPDVVDHTDFGTENIGGSVEHSFTIQNTGGAPLSMSSIVSDNANFVVSGIPGSVPANSSATFTVTFSPVATGTQTATITINNNDCDEAVYNFAVAGMALPPLPILGVYANTTLPAGGNILITPSAQPANTTSAVAYTNTNFKGILSVDPATGVVMVTAAKQAGTYTITVKASGPGGTVTRTFILTVTDPGCSQGLFSSGSNVGVGNQPSSVAIGDFNGDGNQDVVTANYNSGSASIRLGDGGGGFSGSTNVGVGSSPKSVAVGDFNGDGKQDIAVANQNSHNVSIRLGDGQGGFSGSTNVAVGTYPVFVAIGDFNGDGYPDFVTANYNLPNPGYVSVRLGDGQGGFSSSADVPVGYLPVAIAVGDFDGDGHQDFATANYGAQNVSIRLGDGSGGFSGGTNVPIGTNPYFILISDFDGDGHQDFATSNYFTNNLSIRLGDGLGGFGGNTNVAVGANPITISTGDFNGDGHQDLAVANNGSASVSIRLGDGLGGFSGNTNVGVGANPQSVAVGDFNGDGRQDFAAANYSSNSVSSRLGAVNEINLQGNGVSIADGDATPDIVDDTDFGNVGMGNNLARSFTIQNTGTGALNISSISSDNALFVVSAAPTSVAAGSSATFMVTFSPTALGTENAVITLNNDDCDEAEYDFAVRGTGVCTAPSFTACPAAITANTESGLCTAAVAYTATVAGGPVPGLSYQFSGATTGSGSGTGSGLAFNTGLTNVTLTASNNCGGDAYCTFTVMVTDNEPPVATCQDITVTLDATGNGSTTAAAVNNNSSDACGIASIALSKTGFTCANVGANTVTLTVTDNNGNSSTCAATVTVQDNTVPTAICQDVTVSLDGAGNGSTTAAAINSGSSDACGIASLALTTTSFTCAEVGANTVTLTVTDNNGNSSTCEATVTVQDNTAPNAVCQNVTVTLDVEGNGSTTAAAVNNGSSDACGIASLALGPTSFTCANVGGNTVTLTVTDNNGNSSTCAATVTVQDNTAPYATCQNVTVTLDVEGNGSTTAAAVNNISSDACGIATLDLSNTGFTCADVGPNTVTLTVTDVNGNSSTCEATVTVNDIPPAAICQDVTVTLDAAGNGSTTVAAVNNGSSDACGITSLALSPTSFTCANVGANTVTLTVTDVNGNSSTCAATVTVQDNTAPTATCQDVTISLDGDGDGSTTAAAINSGSSDACGIASLALSPASFTCANVGANPVTLTVTDNNGNSSTCAATVTVQDNTAPYAACQNVTVTLDVDGNGSTTADAVNNNSNDACGIAALDLSNTGFTCANVGPNTVTLTVTDVNGNSSTCEATVTVNDIPPAAICQDVTVTLDAAGDGGTTAAAVNNGSSDACGIASLALSTTSFTCTDLGANTVTLTVTDVNGNSSSCTATVTVQDITPPTVTANLIALANPNFEVDCSASDVCDPSPAVVSLMTIPSLSGPAVEYKVKPKKKLVIDTGLNTVKVEAPDPQAFWATVLSAGGVSVADGLVLQLVEDPGTVYQYNFQNNGDLKGITGPAMTLRCTATDASGNSATATAVPVFPVNLVGSPGSGPNLLRKADSSAAAARNAGTSNTLADADLSVFPNPFSTSTTIRFDLPQADRVQVEVFNLQGQRVRILQSAQLDAGVHELRWDETSGTGTDLESGIYLIRLRTGDTQLTKKVSLMR